MAAHLDKPQVDSKYIYYLEEDFVGGGSSYIIITNKAYKIVRIITPYSEFYGYPKNELLVNHIKCDICGEKHYIGDTYDAIKCEFKFPNHKRKYTDANELLDYLSKLYWLGNPGKWAGHILWLSSDEMGDLLGVYEDLENNKIYRGFVDPLRDSWYSPESQLIEFNNELDANDVIYVHLDEYPSSENNYNRIISYKGHVANKNKCLKQDIYNRIWHLLLVDNSN